MNAKYLFNSFWKILAWIFLVVVLYGGVSFLSQFFSEHSYPAYEVSGMYFVFFFFCFLFFMVTIGLSIPVAIGTKRREGKTKKSVEEIIQQVKSVFAGSWRRDFDVGRGYFADDVEWQLYQNDLLMIFYKDLPTQESIESLLAGGKRVDVLVAIIPQDDGSNYVYVTLARWFQGGKAFGIGNFNPLYNPGSFGAMLKILKVSSALGLGGGGNKAVSAGGNAV